MQLHNHRLALNTRMANRFGVNRLKKGTGPIEPCDKMAIGDPGDLYKFTANAEEMLVVIVNRRGPTQSANPAVTTTGHQDRQTLQNDHSGNHGGICLTVLRLIGCVVGGEVTVKQAASDRLLGWTMVAAVGMQGTDPIDDRSGYCATMSSSQVGDSFWIPPNTPECKVFWVVLTTTPLRGRINLYASYPGITLDAETCHGQGLDDPSISPPTVTGGWYSMSFWTAGPRTSNNWCSARWDRQGPEPEYGGARGTFGVRLKGGLDFVGHAVVTKA